MSEEFLNLRTKKEIEIHINLLEERMKELASEHNLHHEELCRLEGKLDALHWVLHNSKPRLDKKFYGE